MDKKSKEALRRYKKVRARAASSSESSSSSDSETGSSSSYSSSDSERKANASRRHRKKKMARSDEERRSKREKRDHCQKKKEAKRDHLKRKLKEAKLKRKAAAAAAVLSGHSHRSSLSPLTQAKLKKLTERRHLREASKERREREKHLAREHGERTPTKLAKIRLHADMLNRQTTKSPQRMHQQLMSREKIIIQTRTHEHTPSVERERARHASEHKLHYDDRRERERERAEREALRDKERAEALARCQERQRERERIAREKQRREEEQKKYGGSSGGNLDRSDYDMMYHSGHSYSERERDRERSLEALERTRYNTKRELDMYERECSYLESDRRSIMEEGELRHERETSRRREATSPNDERYIARVRDVREIYPEEEHERSFNRSYHGEPSTIRYPRERNASNWQHGRDEREPGEYVKRDQEHNMYEGGHDHEALRGRERKSNNPNEWKANWEHNEWASTPNKIPHGRSEFNESMVKNESCLNSETDWDADEHKDNKFGKESTNNELKNESNKQESWLDNKMNVVPSIEIHNRPNEWHNEMPEELNPHRMLNNTPNFNRGRPYRDRPGVGNYRQHPPPLMNMNVQAPRHPYHGTPRPMNKRNMTYTNPNIIKKQQAALAAAKAATQASAVAAATAVAAAKAAAQSAANATTNPGILGQVRQYAVLAEKPEAGEILVEEKKELARNTDLEKVDGELSEISDSDDEILTNMDKKPQQSEVVAESEVTPLVETTTTTTETVSVIEETVVSTVNNEEEDMMAFEEISDGEFEEDTRLKNVADALGVDWASLIAESKAQATEKIETTSAKQRWEAHRVLLQVGVSHRLAGKEFAENILKDIQQKLQLDAAKELDMKSTDEKLENIKPTELQLETASILDNIVDKPLACSQVYVRENVKKRNQMFSNICGPYSRALSARQDLRLRRQLCGLSADDCHLSKPLPIISDKIKNLALNAFKCALEAK